MNYDTHANCGDAASLAARVAQHRTLVYRVCLRVLGNHHDAEDATQATFMVFMKKHLLIRKDADIAAWLHGVARNISLRSSRKRSRRAEVALGETTADIPAGTGQPNEEERTRLLAALDREIAALSPTQRQAVILCYLEGCTREEAARQVGCPAGTLGWRANKGLEILRKRLTKCGFTLTGTTLSAILAAETAATIPETLQASIMTALKTLPAATGLAKVSAGTTALKLAHETLRAMFWAKVKATAAVALAVAAVGGAGITAATAAATGANQPEPSVPLAIQNNIPSAVMITPRTWNAFEAFDLIVLHGGPKVAVLGWPDIKGRSPATPCDLIIPANIRFQSVTSRELVEAVAVENNLKTKWSPDGKRCVLYPGAADSEIERVRNDLASSDVPVRREAAWRAKWVLDARTVPLLVKATKDADKKTAWLATTCLRKMGWCAVLLLDDSAIDLLTADMNSSNNTIRARVFQDLQLSGFNLFASHPEKALPIFEKMLASKDLAARGFAISSLANLGQTNALLLIEKALDDPNPDVRRAYDIILSKLDGTKAFALIEKAYTANAVPYENPSINIFDCELHGKETLTLIERAMTNQNGWHRHNAVVALGGVGDAKKYQLLEKALANPDDGICYDAAVALIFGRGKTPQALRDKALALVEQTLAGKQNDMPGYRLSASLRILGEHRYLSIGQPEITLPLLDKMITNQHNQIRWETTHVMGRLGGEQVLPLLEKALADEDPQIQLIALRAMENIGGEKVPPIIEKVLANDKNNDLFSFMSDVLSHDGAGKKSLELLAKSLVDKNANIRQMATIALDSMNPGGENFLQFLSKAFTNQDNNVRCAIVFAMGNMNRENTKEGALQFLENAITVKAMSNSSYVELLGQALIDIDGEKAFEILKHALSDKNPRLRFLAFCALCRMGGDRALALLEKGLSAPDVVTREAATRMLGSMHEEMGDEKTLVCLGTALTDTDFNVRLGAADAVINVSKESGEITLPLVEKEMNDKHAWIRIRAVEALHYMGGEKAVALLEKTLSDQDGDVRARTVMWLSSIEGNKALPLLEKAIKDTNADVRCTAVNSLLIFANQQQSNKGQARVLFLKLLVEERDRKVLVKVCDALRMGNFNDDPDVKQALKDFQMPPAPPPPTRTNTPAAARDEGVF